MNRVVIALVLALGARGAVAQPSIDNPPEHTEQRSTDAGGADRRPLYVLGGVVVLVALMIWNRRHRAELDRRSEDETRRIRDAARARRAQHADADAGADADADPDARTDDDPDPDAADLAAAAKSSDQEPS